MDAPPILQLRVHRRVAQQNVTERDARRVLDEVLPRLVPFPGRRVHALVALLDWDHRLPSRTLTLRIHLCDSEPVLERLVADLDEVERYMDKRDRFPEFDVPDYDGPEGNEAYAVDLSVDGLAIEGTRFVSRWRREVSEGDRARAVSMVESSVEFEQHRAAVAEAGQDSPLGELEAVGWVPPFESKSNRWTVDVWWLTSFDGAVGRGLSFLVDPAPVAEPEARTIVGVREFAVRAG